MCVCVLQIRAARLEQLEKELQEARGSQDSQLQVRRSKVCKHLTWYQTSNSIKRHHNVVTFDPFLLYFLVLNSFYKQNCHIVFKKTYVCRILQLKWKLLLDFMKLFRILYLLCFQLFGSETPPAGETEKFTLAAADVPAEGSKVPRLVCSVINVSKQCVCSY